MNKLIFPALMLLSVACKRGDFDLSEITAEHGADTDEAAIGADGEETRVETDGTKVETGSQGTRVETNGTKVETGPNGTRVETDGTKVEADGGGTRVNAKQSASSRPRAQANPTSPAETGDDDVVGPGGVKAPGVEVAPGRVKAPGVEVTPNGVTAPGVEIKY